MLAMICIASPLIGEPTRPLEARGNVHVKVRSDGTKMIVNETSKQRARRQSERLETPEAELAHWIDFYARRENLNPKLVRAVVQVESGFNPKALSRKGARGLMQLMPATAELLGVTDAYDPQQNLRGGTRYLRQQLNRFPNLSVALAAYNAGPTAVARYEGIPPYRETRNYVRKVLGLLGLSQGRPVSVASRDKPPETAVELEPAAESKTSAARGRQVYVSRGENNRLSFTTAPPKSR